MSIVRNARVSAGLTQKELATRLGTTQSAIARLERPDANPRIDTLRRALEICDMDLVIDWRPRKSSIDETLVASHLRIPRSERLQVFERSYANTRELVLEVRASRGDLA